MLCLKRQIILSFWHQCFFSTVSLQVTFGIKYALRKHHDFFLEGVVGGEKFIYCVTQ